MRKAQKPSGFWANRTYWLCIKDNVLINADTGEVWYWEHCGMMSDTRYAKHWHDKEKFYAKNGIERGKNLIVTEEFAGEGLDSHQINEMIKDVFLL